jgi:hypothetical protein
MTRAPFIRRPNAPHNWRIDLSPAPSTGLGFIGAIRENERRARFLGVLID